MFVKDSKSVLERSRTRFSFKSRSKVFEMELPTLCLTEFKMRSLDMEDITGERRSMMSFDILAETRFVTASVSNELRLYLYNVCVICCCSFRIDHDTKRKMNLRHCS